MHSLHRVVFFFAASLYVLSLTLPTFFTGATLPHSYGPGYGVLVLGWLGVFDGIYAWYGNLALFFSWFFCMSKMYKTAIVMAIISPIISLSFLFVETMSTNEGGGWTTIEGYGSGYWVWIASQILSFFAILLTRLRS